MMRDCLTISPSDSFFEAALMLLKIFSPLPLAAVALIVISSAILIPQSARSADLRLPSKPIVRHDPPSDWRTRLFEDFRRYLQRRNQ